MSAGKNILIVDDNLDIGDLITLTLRDSGHHCHQVTTCAEALAYLDTHVPSLILLDVNLPDGNGRDFLKTLKQKNPQQPVMMISAHGSIALAMECIQLGAYDFVEKPFHVDELQMRVAHLFEKDHLEKRIEALEFQLGEKHQFKSLVGKSPVMARVFERIEIAAQSDINVLVTGESGTGKELVSRAIHFNGPRASGPFVAINCSALPAQLLESELFGHEKGSFTGAVAKRIGKFEAAQGGTLFLDEIGEMPMELQSKLLRVLQEREFDRLGSNETVKVTARFVFATNQDLKKQIVEKKFREDLFFRINGLPIEIPPLRQRSEDILPLIQFIASKNPAGKPAGPLEIDPAAAEILFRYPWPGNVRELENFVERTLLLKRGERSLQKEDVISMQTAAEPLSDLNLEAMEKKFFIEALKQSGGHVAKAAGLLGISRDTAYRKLKSYSLQSYTSV